MENSREIARGQKRNFQAGPITTDAELGLRLVIDNMPSLIAYLDSSARYRLVNKAYQNFVRMQEVELVGKHVRFGVGESTYRVIKPYIDKVLSGKRATYEKVINDKAGEEHYLSANLIPFIDSTGQQNGFLVIVNDVTEQKQLQHKIEESNRLLEHRVAERTKQLEQEIAKAEILASYDYLTGILNRRAFFQYATSELSRAKRKKSPLAISIFDIDLFKNINDEFGHCDGDEVLIDLATTIRSGIRPSDLFARIGGEEFVIMTPETGIHQAAATMERLRLDLEGRVVGQSKIRYTASFGLTGIDPSIDTIDSALRRADMALYQAKNAGRNQIVLA